MPRSSPSGITIGFLGTGVMDADPAIDLIEVYINESIKPDEPAKFIFPVVENEFSDTMGRLSEMARKSKISYEVITNSEDKKRRAFQETVNGAANTHLVTDIWTQMEQILGEASKSTLMVLWDEKRDEELTNLTWRFVDAGITVLDLTNSLAQLGREEGEEGEGPEAEPEADEDDGEEEAVEVDTASYTRAALEKMSHADVKDIAVGMGLAPRKARENMITAILDAQGTPETATVAPIRPQAVAAAPVAQEGYAVDLTGLQEVLNDFGQKFMEGLDDWLTKFSTAAEGWAFNLKPEEPMEVEPEPEPEPSSRRRLVRR